MNYRMYARKEICSKVGISLKQLQAIVKYLKLERPNRQLFLPEELEKIRLHVQNPLYYRMHSTVCKRKVRRF